MKRVIFVSDFDLKGSGYFQISAPLCKGLSEKYDVQVVGMNYTGEQHDFPFSIIPCKNFQDAHAIIYNLSILEPFDVIIVALDLPHQAFFLEKLKDLEAKYICITPLENPPLTMSWAAPLLNADGIFFISEMGAQSARDAGITDAEHIHIGIDSDLWKPPTKEERTTIRKTLGVSDKFVVLTVADNQERKNLWAALEIIAKAKADGIDNLKYILITRENLTFGWRLRDLATELGINEELNIVEKGIPFEGLWTFYAAADVFLLTSKAEGLGLPVLESMACGVPVLANRTGAIPELLEDEKGYIIEPEYSFRDVWGNAWRDMTNIKKGAKLLQELSTKDHTNIIKSARKYAESRTWDKPTKQLIDKIEEITNA